MPSVVFRADASASIGAGHVMRSFALASAFQKAGWTVGLAASAETFDLIARLELHEPIERQIVLGDSQGEPAELMSGWPQGIDVLVIDHYRRGLEFEKSCRTWAKRIIILEDLPNRLHDADILVSGGAMAAAPFRSLVQESCRILVGAPYALVRPEFVGARPRALERRSGGPVERVLVSFGLSETGQKVALALESLAMVRFAGAVDVVMLASGPSPALSKASATFHNTGADMPGLMTAADLAIGAAGAIAWERCCLGLPAIYFTDGENQRGIAEAVAAAGAGIHVGSADAVTTERLASAIVGFLAHTDGRVRMAQAAADLVDGRGAERVLQALFSA